MHLDVEVAHADGALAGFADDGEGFRQEVVEGGAFRGVNLVLVGKAVDRGGDARLEFGGFVAEFFVGERQEGGLEAIDLLEERLHLFDGALVAGAEDLAEYGVDQSFMSLLPRCARQKAPGARPAQVGCG